MSVFGASRVGGIEDVKVIADWPELTEVEAEDVEETKECVGVVPLPTRDGFGTFFITTAFVLDVWLNPTPLIRSISSEKKRLNEAFFCGCNAPTINFKTMIEFCTISLTY